MTSIGMPARTVGPPSSASSAGSSVGLFTRRSVDRSIRVGTVALVAAPVLWLAAWTLMRVDGHHGPGWGWTSAHVAFLGASAAYAVAAVALGRIAGGGRAPNPAVRLVLAAATLAAVAGAVAFMGQAAVDLYVGSRATSHEAMHDVYAPILATPGVETWLFGIGPSLLFAGVFVLVLLGAARRRVPAAAAWLFGVGSLAQVAGRMLPDRYVALEGVGIGLEVLALGAVAAGAHDPRHGR